MMSYILEDATIEGSRVCLDVVALAERDGICVKISCDSMREGTELISLFGGVGEGSEDNVLSEFDVEQARNNVIETNGNVWMLGNPSIGTVVFSSSPRGASGICFVDGGFPGVNDVFTCKVGALPMLATAYSFDASEVHVAVVTSTEDEGRMDSLDDIPGLFALSCRHYGELSRKMEIVTPDEKLNIANRFNCISIDAGWRPPSFLHGAIRWGSGLGGWWLGWRGWYGSDSYGWHERVREAIRFHSQFQITADSQDVSPSNIGKFIPYLNFGGQADEKELDSLLNIYDMTSVYLDHIYHYYCWTGDRELIKELYPKIRLAMEWQKREFDPDDDGLYENFANTWISDGHWYNGGGCAQASAYNYRFNVAMAEYAAALGKDPKGYLEEAKKIREAMNSILWLKTGGRYAEYRDYLGHKMLHQVPELASVYIPAEFDVPDSFQSYQMLRYVEDRLWKCHDLLLANDWYPVTVTNACVIAAESENTILAFYKIGETEKAYRLLSSCIKYHTFLSDSRDNLNFHFQNEEPSLLGKCIVEGLFGIQPRLQEGMITIMPGFPERWKAASIRHDDIEYSYRRDDTRETISIRTGRELRIVYKVMARSPRISAVRIDGKRVEWRVEEGINRAYMVAEASPARESTVEIEYGPGSRATVRHDSVVSCGHEFQVHCENCTLAGVHDPQGILRTSRARASGITAMIDDVLGTHVFFVRVKEGDISYWKPIDIEVRMPVDIVFSKQTIRVKDNKDIEKKTPVEIQEHAVVLGDNGEGAYLYTVRNNRDREMSLQVVWVYPYKNWLR